MDPFEYLMVIVVLLFGVIMGMIAVTPSSVEAGYGRKWDCSGKVVVVETPGHLSDPHKAKLCSLKEK